jgi:hypothetical protein
MGENEKNVVLFVVDSSALEDVDDCDGEEVHAEEDVLEGRIDQIG